MAITEKKLTLSSRDLKALVKHVVEGSLQDELAKRALVEKEKHVATDDAVDDLFVGDEGGSGGEAPPTQSSDGGREKSLSVPQPETGAPAEPREGEVDLDMVVDKLNTIRAGHSFKEDNVSLQMKRYFEDLDDTEKLALYAFLKGIAQIVSGEVEGQQAMEPSDAPDPGVKMTPKTGNGKPAQPATSQASSKPVAKPASKMRSGENTSAPTPITPKHR